MRHVYVFGVLGSSALYSERLTPYHPLAPDWLHLPVKLTSPTPDTPATPGARLSITTSAAQAPTGAVGIPLPAIPAA